MPDATTTPPSYAAMHSRLNHRRGLARRRACVDCGQPARHWSYDHADPNEVTSASGLEYSTEPAHYAPRCRSCHFAFDQAYRKTGIPRLHALAAELEPHIRAAVHEREKARKRGNLKVVAQLDIELERLTASLETPRAERPTARL